LKARTGKGSLAPGDQSSEKLGGKSTHRIKLRIRGQDREKKKGSFSVSKKERFDRVGEEGGGQKNGTRFIGMVMEKYEDFDRHTNHMVRGCGVGGTSLSPREVVQG